MLTLNIRCDESYMSSAFGGLLTVVKGSRDRTKFHEEESLRTNIKMEGVGAGIGSGRVKNFLNKRGHKC